MCRLSNTWEDFCEVPGAFKEEITTADGLPGQQSGHAGALGGIHPARPRQAADGVKGNKPFLWARRVEGASREGCSAKDSSGVSHQAVRWGVLE